MSTFQGLPPGLFEFFTELQEDNSKAFWQANRSHGAEDPLKTAPRGYLADHPRIHHLRWKGAAVIQEWERDDWMHTRQALDAIRSVWHGAESLKTWFETYVSECSRERL